MHGIKVMSRHRHRLANGTGRPAPATQRTPLTNPAILRPKRGLRQACVSLLWLAASLLIMTGAHAQAPEPAEGGETSSDDSYRLGKGLHIPGTDLTLGGYATASYQRLTDQPPQAGLDNLSLFVWWEGNSRWKFFAELDYEHMLSSRSPDEDDAHHYLALERLYVDYAVADSASVRVGKFLTPIGRWNLIHATPLVWTTSRPLVTQNVFPTNATGLMLSGSLPDAGEGLEYAVYAADGSELRPSPELDTFHRAVGAHFSFPLMSAGRFGLSYAAFEQNKTRGEQKQLLGFDYVWTHSNYELSAEGVYRFSDNGREWDEKGAFAQLVVPLSAKLFAVTRCEIYRQAHVQGASQLWVAGLNYRIKPALVLKAEWIGGRNNDTGAPEGFMSSLSVLF